MQDNNLKIGIIFPGQGAQFLGMGKDFYDNERIVQELFEEASACLETNFTRLFFASSDKELRETVNAQTSIFLLSASIYSILEKKYDIKPCLVAGHSSGEYAATYAAGGMTFPDALYLLKKRASFMEEFTKEQNSGMIAVIGLDYKALQEVCSKYNFPEDNLKVLEIVNYNSSTQLVVSGTNPELEFLQQDLKVNNSKAKLFPLNVSGAFHSRLMNMAQDQFSQYLVKVDFKDLNIDLVNNVQAQIIRTGEMVKASLTAQMSSPVLWQQSMQHFKNLDLIIEVGPSDKLARMLKREWPDKNIFAITNLKELENILNILGKNIIPSEMVLENLDNKEVKENKQEQI